MKRKRTIGKEIYTIASQLFKYGRPHSNLPPDAKWLSDPPLVGLGGGMLVICGECPPLLKKTADGKFHFYPSHFHPSGDEPCGKEIKFVVDKDGNIEVFRRTQTGEIFNENLRGVSIKRLEETRDTMRTILEYNQKESKKSSPQ